MKLSNAFSTGLTLSISLFISACAVTDADKIADAQICLDKSTQATAQACLTKIEGISSKSASLIRCSANFITEGIAEGTRLSDAIGQAGGGTLGMMNGLAFRSQPTQAENQTFADETFSQCDNAGNPGFVLIASFSRMATTLETAGADLTNGTFDPNTLSTASNEVLGATALAAYSTSCESGQESNSEMCGKLSAAIAANPNDMEALGAALAADWDAGN